MLLLSDCTDGETVAQMNLPRSFSWHVVLKPQQPGSEVYYPDHTSYRLMSQHGQVLKKGTGDGRCLPGNWLFIQIFSSSFFFFSLLKNEDSLNSIVLHNFQFSHMCSSYSFLKTLLFPLPLSFPTPFSLSSPLILYICEFTFFLFYSFTFLLSIFFVPDAVLGTEETVMYQQMGDYSKRTRKNTYKHRKKVMSKNGKYNKENRAGMSEGMIRF